MILKELLDGVSHELIKGELSGNVENVVSNSNEVAKGSAFIAIAGYKVDGHKFISTAISKGADVIILEEVPKELVDSVTYIRVKDTRIAMSQIANNFYGHPSSKLKVIGITGTNGKTSTSIMLKSLLEASGKKAGIIGTIGSFIGTEKRTLKNTTPESIELQKILKDMVDESMDYAIMEVSSHALQLNRVSDIAFNHGIFTNLTQDHLDFHGNMDEYFKQKRKLFYITSEYNIINTDDSYGRILYDGLKKEGKQVISYGLDPSADVYGTDVKYAMTGVDFTLWVGGEKQELHCPIPGKFTVYNVLGAIAAALCEGIPLEIIAKGVSNIPPVPGRIERVDIDAPYQVIIDFAHTPDGLENVISSLKEHVRGRLITLFGCGGDRDRAKRPIMGKIAGQLSDYCIVTSDNPRSEDPEKIVKDIVEGVEATDCPYRTIVDRREAIRFALQMAREGDVILLAGKGHETEQIIGDRVIAFDEKAIVKELLRE